MNGLREGVSEIFRSLAKGRKVTYADLKELAKTKKVAASKLYSEAVWACGLVGVDARSLVTTAPSHLRSPPKKPARHFPKKGILPEDEKRLLPSRIRLRDEWARARGYGSWKDVPHGEWLHRMGFATRGEYNKAQLAEVAQRYAALLSNLYRAGVPRERAELLVDLAITRKGIPRARLRKIALALSKAPLLYPGRRKRVFDASLPRYKRRFAK